MPSVQWAITVSPELAKAIDGLAKARGDSRSGLIELLLREHGLVQRTIGQARGVKPRKPKAANDIDVV